MQVNANTAEADTRTRYYYGPEEHMFFYSDDEEMQDPNWQDLIGHDDYEINVQYPYEIRRKDNERVVKRRINKVSGYWEVALNGKTYYLHRLIAKQFIPNPNPQEFTVVDHINHDKTDYHIENLRWTSQRNNINNMSHQSFVEDISPDAIVVDSYRDWTFEGLYFHDDVFYMYNGINYVVKTRYQNKLGYYYIQATDMTGVKRSISYIKFKKEYDLI